MDVLNTTFGCNRTAYNHTAIRTGYDAEGALKFTVAVVMVYGVAVIGVFAVSYVSRRKPQNFDVDKQARTYVKTLDNVRLKLERNNRLHSINSLLKNIHGGTEMRIQKPKSIQDGILSYVAFPVMVASGDTSKRDQLPQNSLYKSEFQCNSPLTTDCSSKLTLSVLTEESECDIDSTNVPGENSGKCDFFVPIS